MKNLFKLCSVLFAAGFLLASCEGPMGPAGKDGTNGTNGANGADGVDANETCKLCHNPEVVDLVAVQFELSKHSYGEAAFEEAGNTTCAPCHESEAFKDVCARNVPVTFTLGTNGKYANDYKTTPDKAYGEISCFTCHSSLHTTYEGTDFSPLTNTAPVSMTMWKGTKTINIAKEGGMGNLCAKCHQPRPLTTSTTTSDGNVVDYAALVAAPTEIFYDNAVGNAAPNKVIPSYRTHVHYGTVGAIFAGVGGLEFPGTLTYESSPHTTAASCIDCHMVEPEAINGRAGGHTFMAKGNFNGCNATDCHTDLSSSSTLWVGTRTDVKALLDGLAAKINAVGGATPILHSESDAEVNLWAGNTTGNWDGYLNIYDPSSNPGGAWKNPGSTSSYTTEQKAINNALPIFPSLTNGVMGAMINFQMCLREYSLGIHNTKYTKALLQNSIETI
jgi:hypothetical protein